MEQCNRNREQTVRCGIVGAGFAAEFHYRALKYVFSAKVEVSGVYSTGAQRLERFASERNLKIYDSLEELIADSDVVHVCTPPVSHEHIVTAVLSEGKDVIVEKPFTGYFGDGSDDFSGDTFPREKGLEAALESCSRMLEAEKRSRGRIMYAENWIYSPAVQKERDIIEKTGAQVLWINGEQSHSGSHSLSYGQWKLSGGGSLIGKGCHPLSAAIYLKHVEGQARNGSPIRPKTVTARTHSMTRLKNFIDSGYLKTHYRDVEDFAAVHLTFEDGTVADIIANELSLGGTNNWIRICANNHRTLCNMSQNDSMQTFAPDQTIFGDVYTVEKCDSKAGWSRTSPDEGWFLGYQHEFDAFYRAVVTGERIESDSRLACDTISVIYSAYLSAERRGEEIKVKNL